MEVLSRAAVLTDEAGRGAYRREYDRLQKSHTTVSEPFPVHRHHQRDRPRRWRRGGEEGGWNWMEDQVGQVGGMGGTYDRR